MIGRPIGGAVARLGGTRRCRVVEQEHETGSLRMLAPSRVPEAVVADFDEVWREHMLEEATDELFGGDGASFKLVSGRLFVRESDRVLRQ